VNPTPPVKGRIAVRNMPFIRMGETRIAMVTGLLYGTWIYDVVEGMANRQESIQQAGGGVNASGGGFAAGTYKRAVGPILDVHIFPEVASPVAIQFYEGIPWALNGPTTTLNLVETVLAQQNVPTTVSRRIRARYVQVNFQTTNATGFVQLSIAFRSE
jgi:hypothetical protein